jgi:predicted enzyme related to lactoylglutathione lyase
MNLNGILIGSEDPQKLVDYYTKLFGAPGWSDSGYTGWLLGNGYVTVGPHSEVSGTSPQPGRVIWNIESSDVKGDFERFSSAGATVIKAPYSMDEGEDADGLIATFADPDGNYFQLMSPMPAEVPA